mmetsp:Transcript_14011/g.36217  ORF Transcript_14011/g.36217 Transcript_14011/m.36217 type:complete len:201 (+) Transcript_14011:432-1034(+)
MPGRPCPIYSSSIPIAGTCSSLRRICRDLTLWPCTGASCCPPTFLTKANAKERQESAELERAPHTWHRRPSVTLSPARFTQSLLPHVPRSTCLKSIQSVFLLHHGPTVSPGARRALLLLQVVPHAPGDGLRADVKAIPLTQRQGLSLQRGCQRVPGPQGGEADDNGIAHRQRHPLHQLHASAWMEICMPLPVASPCLVCK